MRISDWSSDVCSSDLTRPRSPDMRLWMWHRTAMQQPAGAKRDLHMPAWLESVQSGQMSPAGRSASPVARYRLVTAWPSKVAAGLARESTDEPPSELQALKRTPRSGLLSQHSNPITI